MRAILSSSFAGSFTPCKFSYIPAFVYMRQFVAFETKQFFAIIKLCSVFTTELAILHDSSAITPPL